MTEPKHPVLPTNIEIPFMLDVKYEDVDLLDPDFDLDEPINGLFEMSIENPEDE